MGGGGAGFQMPDPATPAPDQVTTKPRQMPGGSGTGAPPMPGTGGQSGFDPAANGGEQPTDPVATEPQAESPAGSTAPTASDAAVQATAARLIVHTSLSPLRARRAARRLLATADHETHFHLTENPHFTLDPDYSPTDNAVAIHSRSHYKGLYTTDTPERWWAQGYKRPYVAEVHVPHGHSREERWNGEKFIPAEHFDKAKVHRVIPIDEHAREQFGETGWIEGYHGTTHDTGEPTTQPRREGDFGARSIKMPQGYKYSGPDVRDMSPEQHRKHYDRWKQYMVGNGGGDTEGWSDDDFDDKSMGLRHEGRLVKQARDPWGSGRNYTEGEWANVADGYFTKSAPDLYSQWNTKRKQKRQMRDQETSGPERPDEVDPAEHREPISLGKPIDLGMGGQREHDELRSKIRDGKPMPIYPNPHGYLSGANEHGLPNDVTKEPHMRVSR